MANSKMVKMGNKIFEHDGKEYHIEIHAQMWTLSQINIWGTTHDDNDRAIHYGLVIDCKKENEFVVKNGITVSFKTSDRAVQFVLRSILEIICNRIIATKVTAKPNVALQQEIILDKQLAEAWEAIQRSQNEWTTIVKERNNG